MKDKLIIQPDIPPKVLLIGNGLLQLAGGGDWSDLLASISTRPVDEASLKGIPYAMRPEILCGVDMEEVQRKTAAGMTETRIHPFLSRLLDLPFDAILTTNYSYEIEIALSGKPWGNYQRQRSLRVLHGSAGVLDNTCMCNLVRTPQGRTVPVFHMHGERLRRHSLVLSYYSYAKSVAKLHALNRERGDQYRERQADRRGIEAWSWLDYFILGDVYSIGFGFNLSEFDVWWALERKAREKARHGTTIIQMTPRLGDPLPQLTLADAFGARMTRFDVTDGNYVPAYEKAIDDIEACMK